MLDRYSDSYENFRQYTINVLHRLDAKVWVKEENEYYACYCRVGDSIVQRNVKKGTSEETQLLVDDWASQKPDLSDASNVVVTSISNPIITHGQEEVFQLIPHVKMESMIKCDTIIQTLEFGQEPSSVMQIFRASTDNLSEVSLKLHGVGSTDITESFEYSTDASMRAVWVPSSSDIEIYSDNGTYYTGSYSIGIDCYRNRSNGESITKTFSSENWSLVESISCMVYESKGSNRNHWKIRIYDGNNWAEKEFTIPVKNVWENKIFLIESLDNIEVLDLSHITKIQFLLDDCNANAWLNIDDFKRSIPSGYADIKLYSFGTSDHPTLLGQPLTFNTNENVATILTPPTPQTITIPMMVPQLTVGEYYGIEISNVSNGVLHIYGSSTQIYNSGQMFTISNSNFTYTTKNMRFMLSTIVSTLLNKIEITFDGDPGTSDIDLPIIHNGETLNECLGNIIFNHESNYVITLRDTNVIKLDKNNILSAVYKDSASSTVSNMVIRLTCSYAPIVRYN